MTVRVRVRPVHYGVGYVAAFAEDPTEEVHGPSFDGALGMLLSRLPPYADPDSAPPAMQDLDLRVVNDDFGQYLLEVSPK